MQRNFEPMRKQVEAWQRSELTDVTAKVVIYEAFVEGKLEAPKHLANTGIHIRVPHAVRSRMTLRTRRLQTVLSQIFLSARRGYKESPLFKSAVRSPQRILAGTPRLWYR
jgi:hypothetical protein